MTKLAWDRPGEKMFESGLDRGVLYHPDGFAVPWNGLVSVAENLSRTINSYYHDGMRIYVNRVRDSYSAVLRAFTFPLELDGLLGNEEHAGGMWVHDQTARPFSLCYRTLDGDDVNGQEGHYKLHLVYNVLAVPNDYTHTTMDSSPAVEPFEFALTSIPYRYAGSGVPAAAYKPISHISMDSRLFSWAMPQVEAKLYGDDANDPQLLNPADLFALVDSL